MKRAIIIVLSSVVVLGAVAWGTYSWLSNFDESKANGSAEEEKIEEKLIENREEIQGTISEEDLAVFQDKNLNPFGENTKKSELTDFIYQEYIHGMSHQKVEASKKWGFYEIHPSRINWLLSGLEKVELEHENVYKEILEKWSNGNFTSADEDHNAIWNLQDGTVGYATGILSAEEEQAYINNNSD